MWLIKGQCNYCRLPPAGQHLRSSALTDARQTCPIGTHQRLSSHLKIQTRRSRFPVCIRVLINHFLSACVCVCVDLPVESNWWMEAELQKCLQQQQQQRMPDRRWIWCIISLAQSVCYPSSSTKLRPHRQFFFSPKNLSVQSICFVITTKGSPEIPNLKRSKGYRCDFAVQSTSETRFMQSWKPWIIRSRASLQRARHGASLFTYVVERLWKHSGTKCSYDEPKGWR